MKKVLVDTNLILRYLLDGDELLPRLSRDNLIWFPSVVIFETVYTLLSTYGLNRLQVFDLVTKLIMRPNVECERSLLFNSLAIFRDNPKLSLVDSFLAKLSEDEGVELATYDKKLRKRVKKLT